MTKRVRSRVQVAEMDFLPKVRDLSNDYQLDKVKSINIRQFLNIKPLLLRIKQLQLRWYGHVTRMFHEQTAKQLMNALLSGKRSRRQHRIRLPNYSMLKTWPGQSLEFHRRNWR